MTKDSLGDRMKAYENINRNYLMRRAPVVIRLDGKAFHTFTRGFNKPFDDVFSAAMGDTMKYLCENIQGCVLGYTQSDEISLCLVDYQKLDSDAWFGYNIQKMVSVAASMATMVFNKSFDNLFWLRYINVVRESGGTDDPYFIALEKAKERGAMFDARCFSLSKEEVCNYFLWRQNDAVRNSISSAAQSLFSHNELLGIDSNGLQDKMFTERGVNWNGYPTKYRRGFCCVKGEDGKWFLDTEIPIFKGRDRAYIDKLIYVGE